jgi:hypothetical protein
MSPWCKSEGYREFQLSIACVCAAGIASFFLAALALAADGSDKTTLDRLAEQYVRLVLAIGEHDADMVDAYYGPPQWRSDAKAQKRPMTELETDARQLTDRLSGLQTSNSELDFRRRGLVEKLESIRARMEVLRGARLPFDDEARRIYGVSPPHHDDAYYREVHRQLDAALPGPGSLAGRMTAWKNRLVVPADRLEQSFNVALDVCRSAALRHAQLPRTENFRIEFVKDKPWSAYNWFQGDFQSLIQVNTSLPIRVTDLVLLMCHEGYPGHHVLNTLLEQQLVKSRGWIEYTVYPLFSSESLLAEGSADFGLELVFPDDVQGKWEKDHLYPVAGVDPSIAEQSRHVATLAESLEYAKIDAARAYLDGARSAEQTAAWLQEFTFATADEAKRSVRFFETYRSYVVNYRLGKDLIRQHIDRVAGADKDARWTAFIELLKMPPTVSELARGTTLDPARQRGTN